MRMGARVIGDWALRRDDGSLATAPDGRRRSPGCFKMKVVRCDPGVMEPVVCRLPRADRREFRIPLNSFFGYFSLVISGFALNAKLFRLEKYSVLFY